MSKWKKWLIGEWSWWRPLKSFAFIYLALLGVALFFSNKLIYQPPQPGYKPDDANMFQVTRPGGENVMLYYTPAAQGMPTLLWSHGNAEDIGYLHDRLCRFNSRGYGILAYDYPGYGHSEGTPTEKGCYEAVEAAYNHLTQKLKVPTEQIIIYGQSVGSGPAVWLAAQKPCRGLLLVSPFVSAFRAVTKVPLFPGDQFKNIHRISDIQSPLLVIHGDEDCVISQWHGKKLYDLHPGPKTFIDIPGAGHNDLYTLAMDQILDALDAFNTSTQEKAKVAPQKNLTTLPDTPAA